MFEHVPVALIATLVAIDVLAVAVILLLRRRMGQADVHVALRTKFGPAATITLADDDGAPVRVLAVGGTFQSATYTDDDRVYDLVFAYDKLYDRMFDAGIPIANVLMLGGGGYAYPKHFIATRPGARMDVVEIDPVITSFAQRYFFLDRLIEEFDTETTGRLGVICADGRDYLDDLAGRLAGRDAPAAGPTGGAAADPAGDSDAADAGPRRYDAVLNDCFAAGRPAARLATVEAARAVRSCLAPGGVYMTNVVSAVEGEGSALLRAIVATLREAFAHVWVIPCANDGGLWDRDNVMVVASDGEYAFKGARAPRAGADGDAAGATVLRDAEDPEGAVKRLTRS